jgi:glyoxylase I family protein
MRVKDFEQSIAFYRDVLEFDVARSWGEPGSRATMLAMEDGGCLEIFEGATAGGDEHESMPVLHFAIRVDDCDSLLERVRDAGAEITVEPKDVDIPSTPVYPVRLAFFKGPDGEIVELFEER